MQKAAKVIFIQQESGHKIKSNKKEAKNLALKTQMFNFQRTFDTIFFLT